MPDTKIKTMEEFATVSGISRPTVSKYFFDPNSVRPKTRARIEEALEQYDYTPNVYAVNQNRRATRTIGIIVPYLTDPFFGEVARAIERDVIDAGFRPIVFSSHGETGLELENLESLMSLKPAGALLAPLGRNSDLAMLERFCDSVPTVLFDSNIDALGLAFVGTDNQQSVATIVRYLCETGEPPCLFENRRAPNPNVRAKLNAYVGTMNSLGHEPHITYVDGDGWDFERIGFEGGMEALKNRAFSTNTILCGNDRLAVGLLAAAYEEGMRVGRGDGCALRVAGHDDHPFSRFTCPPLTTVSQNTARVAHSSVGRLISQLETGDIEAQPRQTILFDGELVIRASA
ncbi:MAG: LacI family DNA-binding transcriptional regulator [Devosiaceae bacterium]